MKQCLIQLLAAILILSCGESADKVENSNSSDEADDGTNSEIADTGNGAIQVSILDNIPNVTDPVLQLEGDGTTETFDSSTGALAIELELIAASGVSLGPSTKATYYDSVNSPAFGSCEMVNRMRSILHEAAAADATTCEFNELFGEDGIPSSMTDGEEHIIELVEDGDVTERYKLKVRMSDDKITNFTIHRCENDIQQLYLKKTVTDDLEVTITSKRAGSDNNGPNNISYKSLTSVTGTMNEDSEFVGVKDMVQTYSNDFNSDGTSVSYNKYRVKQSSQNIALIGYATQSDKSTDDLLMSFFNLIDENNDDELYDLNNLAVGAGAILFDLGDGPEEQGWQANGSKDSDAPLLAKVSGQTPNLPTPPSSTAEHIDFDFTGDEIWDCSGTATVTIDESDHGEDDDEETCTQFELPQEQSYHLECQEY